MPRVVFFSALILLAAQPGLADDGATLVTDDAFLRSSVSEPVFAFVFAMVQADSFGTWTAADLEAFAARWVQPSVFPLELLESITRQEVPAAERSERHGVTATRRWVIRMAGGRLDMPMPYSILGYHPGTLSFGSPITAREWPLGERRISVRSDQGTTRRTVAGLTVFQIVDGWAILDVDGWLDKLLGEMADDAATIGFAAGRIDGRIIGIGDSVGRDGRFIYGELDFAESTIVNHGRPLAKAIAGHVRRWCEPDSGDRKSAWTGYATGTN